MKRAAPVAAGVGIFTLIVVLVFGTVLAITDHRNLERWHSEQSGILVVQRDHLARLDGQVATAQSSANDAASKADHGQVCAGAHDLQQRLIGLKAGDPYNADYYETFIVMLTAICGDDPGV